MHVGETLSTSPRLSGGVVNWPMSYFFLPRLRGRIKVGEARVLYDASGIGLGGGLPPPCPPPQAGEGKPQASKHIYLAALALLLTLASSLAAYACPDLATAPGSRWTLRTEHGAATLVTPCGESFY